MGLMAGLIGQFVVQLPLLVIVVIGGILLLTRRGQLPQRGTNLGLVGLGLLVLSVLADTVWYASLPALFRSDVMSYGRSGMISFVAGLLLALLHAAGIGMLVMGLVSRAEPAPAGHGFGPAPTGPGFAGFPGVPGTPGAPGGAYPPPGSPYAAGYQPYPAPPQQPGPAVQPAPQQQGWTPPDQPRG